MVLNKLEGYIKNAFPNEVLIQMRFHLHLLIEVRVINICNMHRYPSNNAIFPPHMQFKICLLLMSLIQEARLLRSLSERNEDSIGIP